MHAMVLGPPATLESEPLTWEDVAVPAPGDGQILVRVERCGVCRTDLHVVEGELPPLGPSMIPGHEIVGTVESLGPGVSSWTRGDRVGVPWLHRTCGHCEYCRSGRENLCPEKALTGYSVAGGYAEHVVADAEFALRLPTGSADRLAPFLCAGIVGYRALKLALPRPGGRIGMFGFGGSAHLALQAATKLGFETVAYSRSRSHLALARELGASETVLSGGGAARSGPPSLDGAIVFAPVGRVVLDALRELKRGGTVSIASIHLGEIPPIDYDRLLFGERRIVSVEANTREDAREFLDLAERYQLRSVVTVRPLREANQALADLKAGKIDGAVVLDCATGA